MLLNIFFGKITASIYKKTIRCLTSHYIWISNQAIFDELLKLVEKEKTSLLTSTVDGRASDFGYETRGARVFTTHAT
jgi:hypothetical protein